MQLFQVCLISRQSGCVQCPQSLLQFIRCWDQRLKVVNAWRNQKKFIYDGCSSTWNILSIQASSNLLSRLTFTRCYADYKALMASGIVLSDVLVYLCCIVTITGIPTQHNCTYAGLQRGVDLDVQQHFLFEGHSLIRSFSNQYNPSVWVSSATMFP